MSCLTRKAVAANPPASPLSAIVRVLDPVAYDATSVAIPPSTRGEAEELPVDDPGAEQGRGQECGDDPGSRDGTRGAAARGVPPEHGGRHDRKKDGQEADQSKSDGAAEHVGHCEGRDQQGWAVDPVVAVERGARSPLRADDQEASLVGAHRCRQEGQPGKADNGAEPRSRGHDDPRRPPVEQGGREAPRGHPSLSPALPADILSALVPSLRLIDGTSEVVAVGGGPTLGIGIDRCGYTRVVLLEALRKWNPIMTSAVSLLSAVTVAVRIPSSRIAFSPKWSPGPRVRTTRS